MTNSSEGYEKCSDLRIPLVLGVTAHRDLNPADIEVLREAVKNIIQKFRDDYSDTPVIVLSALAEGGDCLCAKAALDFFPDIEVVAALPFPPEIYRTTSSFNSN